MSNNDEASTTCTIKPVPSFNEPKTSPIINKQKVAVAMSGGVDSSVTAYLLKEAGYEVVGLTGWLVKSGSRCCDTAMVDAAKVCEQLEVEHHVVDLLAAFKSKVMDNFPKSYAQARTPLPCSLCNTEIKWGALLNYGSKVLKANYIATGHYARIIRLENEVRLTKAYDLTKDQSYVLWGITKEQLTHTLLPLGDYTKDKVRQIAKLHNLASATRKESQDLCFIPKGQTVKQYLADYIPLHKGDIIHMKTGQVLGSHDGFHNYTIGQRKGLGIAYSEPIYVVKLDPINNVVYVGDKESLLNNKLTASLCNWIIDKPKYKPFEALAKIRYNSSAELAIVTHLDDNKMQVEFLTPQPAITSGQVLAIYELDDEYLIGGGWID